MLRFAAAVPTMLALALALESSGPNMKVPSGLARHEVVFGIVHRYYGKLTEDPIGTHLGIDQGANVGVSLRGRLLAGLDLGASYSRLEKEYTAGAGYAVRLAPARLRAGFDVGYFDYKMSGVEERRHNFFYQLCLQTESWQGIIAPVLAAAYDGYNERLGYGAGIVAGIDHDFGPVHRVDIVAEYFPVVDRDTSYMGPKNSFCIGTKFSTYGHHFMLVVGNSTQIGARRLMLGAPTNDLYFGINIHRYISL